MFFPSAMATFANPATRCRFCLENVEFISLEARKTAVPLEVQRLSIGGGFKPFEKYY